MESGAAQRAKNDAIAKTMRRTKERHAGMDCKVYTCKIQESALKPAQREAVERVFAEAKWFYNHTLAWLNAEEGRKLSDFDSSCKDVIRLDKDGNEVEETLRFLTAQSRQESVQRMMSNMKALRTLKVRGRQRPGRLKFKSSVNIVQFKQYGVSHRIISETKVKLAGIPKHLRVNGLSQFVGIVGFECACAKLLKRADGYFIQFTVYVPKGRRDTNGNSIGVDFGCQTALTLSDGRKIHAKVGETERLKVLQRKLSRQQKGSNGYRRTKALIAKEHQRMVNRRDDIANKAVHGLLEYDTVVMQDEQVASWHKGGHGRSVQCSILGRVKRKLIANEGQVVVLSRMAPTTKLCRKCGAYADGIAQWDRTFECPSCGAAGDRDIHAAENMVWMYEHGIGVGRTDFKRVEIEALLSEVFSGSTFGSMKHEAACL